MGFPASMSKETVEIIAATAGVVAPKALEITRTFYSDMLKAHPELNSMFNQSRNVVGSDRQPEALACAVVAYASNISDLSPLLQPGGAMEAMSHRHCALCVEPPHYQVVHDQLMAAVGQVLDGVLTPEIGAAWSEAVKFLSKVCIDTQESIYQSMEQRRGGWSGWETFEVTAIEDVAEDVRTFTFKPPRNSALHGRKFEFTPGQYVTIKVDLEGDGLTAPRHYTVTSPPDVDHFQCTVKKLSKGKVSTYLHERLRVGDEVQLTAPLGIFTPDASIQGAVLISAGIGETPMVNLSRVLGDKVKLAVNVNRTPEAHVFKNFFQTSGLELMQQYTAGHPRHAPEDLAREVVKRAGADNAFYVCGPESWMEKISSELLAQGASEVKTEVFDSQMATRCPFVAHSTASADSRCPASGAKGAGCPVSQRP